MKGGVGVAVLALLLTFALSSSVARDHPKIRNGLPPYVDNSTKKILNLGFLKTGTTSFKSFGRDLLGLTTGHYYCAKKRVPKRYNGIEVNKSPIPMCFWKSCSSVIGAAVGAGLPPLFFTHEKVIAQADCETRHVASVPQIDFLDLILSSYTPDELTLVFTTRPAEDWVRSMQHMKYEPETPFLRFVANHSAMILADPQGLNLSHIEEYGKLDNQAAAQLKRSRKNGRLHPVEYKALIEFKHWHEKWVVDKTKKAGFELLPLDLANPTELKASTDKLGMEFLGKISKHPYPSRYVHDYVAHPGHQYETETTKETKDNLIEDGDD